MYIAAPLLLLAYGVIRLIDGRDGAHGPGPAWTTGHLLFLASLLIFGLIALDVRRRLNTVPGAVAAAATLVGLIAFVKTVVIDIVVGLRASDHEAMHAVREQYESGADRVVDPLSPLFPIGLAVLLVLLAVSRRVPWWSPVLAVCGFCSIVATLDLLPVAAMLLLVALVPLARERTPAAVTR
ncbi:hypothetical protein [Cryptosporangium phraense]|uniref:Uncharacterized protein n=1 Tax=Cryptosporangium phraense TaxID=2593070 RepID=A0A545B0A6_9ACTN|nr:hypothetical protein [Cryptosporangium phraense]TQS47020.1 hypothetical protein FL583_01800 [Cryptosporangium phraense]